MKPKYKNYTELAAAFKAGKLKGYYIMLDKGGTENSLALHYDDSLSEAENERRQNATSEIFICPDGVEKLYEALGIPCEWC